MADKWKREKCSKCDGTGVQYDDKQVGADLRREREKAGLFQREVAERMGFRHAYVSHLESGARRWTDKLIKRFREAIRDHKKRA